MYKVHQAIIAAGFTLSGLVVSDAGVVDFSDSREAAEADAIRAAAATVPVAEWFDQVAEPVYLLDPSDWFARVVPATLRGLRNAEATDDDVLYLMELSRRVKVVSVDTSTDEGLYTLHSLEVLQGKGLLTADEVAALMLPG